MGTWALEFNPGIGAGSVYKMVYFSGDVFGFCYSAGGAGAGVWRRTPPGPPLWTQTLLGWGGRGCVWDGRMWGDSTANPNAVFRSNDGISWVEDWDSGLAPWDHWSAMNAYSGEHLRVGSRASGAGPGNKFYYRNRAGNWTQHPIAQADNNHFYDIIGYGGYYPYLSAQFADVYRWTGAAWQDEPTLDNGRCFFTEHNGVLYATKDNEIYRRGTTGGWVLDLPAIGVGWWFPGAVSVGGDGVLYAAGDDGANSRVYARVGGHWVLHSTAAGVRFNTVGADAAGNMYAGTNDCRFYAYTASFAVTPVGQGLHPQAMDVDGDGDALYVGLYNAAAQPILVKVAAPLVNNAMGNAVFNPADGDAINVKCGGVGGELAISGNFAAAGNEQVEVSEDGGGTWTDIDRDAWGVERAQPLLVDPDDAANVVMVALQTAQDIVETFDGGATPWVTRNAAVGYAPAALARLPEGDELVVGDAHAARKVEYSPNRGVTLQDITGGAAIGNVVALEVA